MNNYIFYDGTMFCQDGSEYIFITVREPRLPGDEAKAFTSDVTYTLRVPFVALKAYAAQLVK